MRHVKGTCTNLWNQACLCAQWVLVGFRPWPRLNQLTGLLGFLLLVWGSHGAGESERPQRRTWRRDSFDRMNENTFTDTIIWALFLHLNLKKLRTLFLFHRFYCFDHNIKTTSLGCCWINTFTDRIILSSSHQTDECSYMLDYFIREQTLWD